MRISFLAKCISLVLVALSAVLSGCNSEVSADDVAAKINAGQPLTNADFERMVTYNAEVCDLLIWRYNKAVTMADVEKVTAEIDTVCVHYELFSRTLLLNYDKLSAEQTERISSAQKRLNDSYPKWWK